MKRRTFLKSIATACGAAVVCPGELLKATQPALRLWPLQKIMIEKIREGGHSVTVPWKNYYADHQYSGAEMKRLLNEFETAFWNTTFKSPFIIR